MQAARGQDAGGRMQEAGGLIAAFVLGLSRKPEAWSMDDVMAPRHGSALGRGSGLMARARVQPQTKPGALTND